MEQLSQSERLSFLLDAFLAEEPEAQGLPMPADDEDRRRLLRSLMNIRMPRPVAVDVLAVQDDYLHARAEEKGVVSLVDIPTAAEAFGSKKPFADRLCLWQGDITRLAVDAIVNAANSQMLGCFSPCHGCIDNCIHTYAGVQLRAECAGRMADLRSRFGPDYEQPTAVPMLTNAYNLPAKKIVHIVGPIVEHRLTRELERQLAACYRSTLALCAENGLRSVAFCCISTGVFRFPAERAAQIAVETVTAWLAEHGDGADRVIFNVHNSRDYVLYEELLR